MLAFAMALSLRADLDGRTAAGVEGGGGAASVDGDFEHLCAADESNEFALGYVGVAELDGAYLMWAHGDAVLAGTGMGC